MNAADMIREGCYFVAAILFLMSLKWLGSPKTARRANFVSMFAMFLAVAPSFLEVIRSRHDHPLTETMGIIVAGLVVGAVIGLVSAYKVQMTAMPQMVGLYNGFGGAASLIVAASEFLYKTGLIRSGSGGASLFGVADAVPVYLSIIIGGVCFTGSMAAFAKLQELISGKPIQFAGQHALNLLLLLAGLAIAGALTLSPAAAWSPSAFAALVAVSLVLGWLVVIPIGGADMPVVISLMNSYSGMAVTTTGFVLRNNVLIIVGSFVGASGIILTSIMCKAMNRSLANVMFGGFGSDAVAAKQGPGKSGAVVNESSPEEVAEILRSASSIIIVPGYGMATSQAQHVVREVGALAEKSGASVRYAIHPVAGRMPGHMNVLLAEANVPYDQLYDLDQINDDFVNTDVVLVVGANDVVNPAAKTNPSSPIYGMPVFNCELARACICLKRSMNPGFAGIDNELYVAPKTMMLFGDAKKSLMAVSAALKEDA
jgi:NAD(P) transhydrogenase subunit beta